MEGAQSDYDPLIALIGSARFVLLGEASHGTHEFYKARAETTKRLIEEKSFNVIAVEADWPDAYRINRYVRSTGTDIDSRGALADFKRFPTWMWRNEDILDFVDWLRGHNDGVEPHKAKTGFYGLDLYSMYSSMDAVLRYLEKTDPPAAKRAIGVIYRPETERQSHYFRANLCQQFDAVAHFDATTAVVPLEFAAAQGSGDTPETLPSGI